MIEYIYIIQGSEFVRSTFKIYSNYIKEETLAEMIIGGIKDKVYCKKYNLNGEEVILGIDKAK